MRFVTYDHPAGPRVAARRGDELVDLNHANSELPSSLKGVLALGAAARDRLSHAVAHGSALSTSPKLLPPVPDPQKIFCIGLNYADHAAESGADIPAEPVVFSKFCSALRGDGDPIELPKTSSRVDYEAELVVVIGRGGRNIPREEALGHVGGYTCGHDVSARDWQLGKPQGQWLLGKSFDSFAPLGPALVTPDEIENPQELDIRLRLNGKTMQQSNTRQLIFGIDQLIAYLSQVCTLTPGDLIFTGTPPGVGAARTPPVFLQPVDNVEVEIERIGILSNPVIAGS
jgi:2-keto-4-pentenoate hydratase/2-oxohepta-3-ene-1,7-dioic acid hydratase in catechol pathway